MNVFSHEMQGKKMVSRYKKLLYDLMAICDWVAGHDLKGYTQ
jgi:hypothetical protein